LNAKSPALAERVRDGEMTLPEAIKLAGDTTQAPIDGAENFVGRTTGRNEIETPLPLCQFLHDLIAPIHKVKTILDPCAGGGNLTKPWNKRKVISFEIKNGTNFFECSKKISCDLVLCNPPFSKSEDDKRPIHMIATFLEQILDITEAGTPIALICPATFRLDNAVRAKRLRWLRDSCPPITSIISLPKNVFDAKVHGEILIFNLPDINPHYFLSEECLQ